jgi:uncharacterized Zn finger protein
MVTGREHGLFPKPKEITMRCSCPDYAGMCKHLAAVMYGVGNRLDSSPESLFLLRGVDHLELIEQAIPASPVRAGRGAPTISTDDLGAIFDIEIDAAPTARASGKVAEKARVASKPAARKAEKPTAKPAVKKARVASKAETKIPVKAAAKPAVKKARATAKATAAKKSKAKPGPKKA